MILMLAGSAINKIALAVGGTALLSGFLNHSDLWVVGNVDKSYFHAKKIDYTSNADQWRKFYKKDNPVVLDIEKWKYTPIFQQNHPVMAYRHFYENLHQFNHEKWIIATPSFNVIKEMFPNYKGKLYRKFIQIDLAGKIAPYANVYEVQAQWAERNPFKYRRVVQKIAEQVHSANPSTVVFAGLSTNPSPKKIALSTLKKDIEMTQKIVSGYWLNVPSNKTYCPSCGVPQPEKAINLIHFFYG